MKRKKKKQDGVKHGENWEQIGPETNKIFSKLKSPPVQKSHWRLTGVGKTEAQKWPNCFPKEAFTLHLFLFSYLQNYLTLICTCAHTHPWTHAPMHTQTHTHTHAHTHTRVPIHPNYLIHSCLCTNTNTLIRAHKLTYKNTHSPK